MTLPAPEPGLVIRYVYLWAKERVAGAVEGFKARPCAVVLASRPAGDVTRVLVVPVTHSPPQDNDEAFELPSAVKRSLGMDADRSWVVLSESNIFDWPGPDLRRVDIRGRVSFAYGHLPPKLFSDIKRRFVELERAARSRRVPRDG